VEVLISYLRYSTPEQTLGRSEHRQIDRFRAWAFKQGWGFDDTYRDPGVSGFRGGHRLHGNLGRILNDIRSGHIDPNVHRLGIESFDRLTRENRIDAFPLFSEIVNSGVPIIVQSLDRGG
jgi:DNA invertase Pin-like site-specific DNA recombinase